MKARDIVHGWPRGRSTRSNGACWFRFWTKPPDPRWAEDEQAEAVEEQRKTEMMRDYYADQMLYTSGLFTELIDCEGSPIYSKRQVLGFVTGTRFIAVL